MTKVSFLGNFGTQNLGNECTLQAILGNLRKHLPDARVECICPDPEDAGARYGIATRQISSRSSHGPQARTWPGHNHAVIRLLRRIVIRVPRELLEWMRAFRALKGTTMLIIPGSGVLGNFGIDVFGLHYEMMKWSLLAKVRGSKVLFVSVGGGRLRHPGPVLPAAGLRRLGGAELGRDHGHRQLDRDRGAVPGLAAVRLGLPRP